MRRVNSLAVVLSVCAVSFCGVVLPASPQTVQSVAEAAVQSVCIVLAEGASGTGFVVADGFILTAHHVVKGVDHLRVLCPDHPAIEVQMINADADNDIAILHNPLLSIRSLPLGDSAKVQVGQEIVVIGFPQAHLAGVETATVTHGIVSSVRAGALQIQAPVGPGNSGSPVLTLQGQVVGVVRAVLGNQVGSNLATSFATSIDAAKPFLTSAVRGLYGGVAVGNAPPVQQASRPAPSFVITPGRGIGDLKLGMHREELETLLGPAKEVSPTGHGGSFVNWFEQPNPPRGFFAVLSSAGEAVLIGVGLDPRYAIQGLHAGSREVDVRATLGEPSRVEVVISKTSASFAYKLLYYDSLGLRFVIVNNPERGTYELVVGIDVVRPGCVFKGPPLAPQGDTCK